MLTRLVPPRLQLQVSDAALPLMLLRREACLHWQRRAETETDSYRMIDVSPDDAGARVLEICRGANRLAAVTRWMSSVESLTANDAQNRQYVAETSARMRSYFDAGSLTPEMIHVLAEARDMSYHVGYGPVQMKLLDRREVLVPGLDNRERMQLLLLRGARAVRAAITYLEAVHRASVPAADLAPAGEVRLTQRQHDVARLLAEGLRDSDAAQRLGVSLRTVRTDVARILEELECETRFAAGAKYSVWAAAHQPPDTEER